MRKYFFIYFPLSTFNLLLRNYSLCVPSIGSFITTSVPAPLALLIFISPPCSFTIRSTMDRPSPVPPVPRERALSTR